jgi:hypothetical protein
MKVFTAVLASALFLAPAAMFAQTPTPGAHDYDINQRKVAQQDRIANGVKDGQLKPGQTARLEHQEAGINREERGMRAQDNGRNRTARPYTRSRTRNHVVFIAINTKEWFVKTVAVPPGTATFFTDLREGKAHSRSLHYAALRSG